MKCLSFKPLEKNTLKGFATLEMGNGLVLQDCTLHESPKGRWVSPPGRPMVDAHGQVVMKDGKAQYAAVVSFTTKAKRDQWSAAAVAAIFAFRTGG